MYSELMLISHEAVCDEYTGIKLQCNVQTKILHIEVETKWP